MVGFNVELYKDCSVSVDKLILIILFVLIINIVVGEFSVVGGYRYILVVGFFVCLNWNYKDCYMLEVNGCYDGFLCFIGDKCWGFFLLFLGGWNIVCEVFFEEIVNKLKIGILKLRVLWG